MKYLALLLTVVLFLPPVVKAQSSPEVLAQEYFDALRTEGFSSSGRFMHPDALIQLKNMLLPVYEVEASSGSRELINATFGESASYSQLVDLEPEQFMNGFLNIIALQLGAMTLAFDSLEVLGTVNENENVHVLSRITVTSGPVSVTQFEVLSFKPYEDTWKLQLNGEWQGMVQALRANVLGQ